MKKYLFTAFISLVLLALSENAFGQAQLVKDINNGAESSGASGLDDAGIELYFNARADNSTRVLWRSDGTERGTLEIGNVRKTGEGVTLNGLYYFPGYQKCPTCPVDDLFRSNGTQKGTFPVFGPPPAQIDPGRPNICAGFGSGLARAGGQIFFIGRDKVHGLQLWRSSGTKDGTIPVTGKNFNSMQCWPWATTKQRYFFNAEDSVYGSELWVSDGTAAGTFMVKDINPGTGSSDFLTPASTNGVVYFASDDGVHGQELWRSDGTKGGTYMVKDINPGAKGSDIDDIVAADGIVYFVPYSSQHGRRVWRSDGTAGGTYMLKDIAPGEFLDIHDPVYIDGTLYFFAYSWGWEDLQLWRSDGTEANTVLVTTLEVGDSPWPYYQAVAGQGFFFTLDDGVHGWELWHTNGTAAGTRLVADIWPGAMDSNPDNLTVICGTLHFSAEDPVHGRELWKYERSRPIRLDVLADGNDEWAVHSNGTDGSLKVHVGVDAGTKKGKQSDWWLRAVAPNGGQYWYEHRKGWTQSLEPRRAYAGPLRNLTPRKVLSAKNLPPGRWRFDFAVDDRDGFLKWGTCDTVNVRVTP